MRRAIQVALATACALTARTPHAAAQASGFAVDRFEPAQRGSDWFVNDGLDLRGAPDVAAGVVFDWSYKPVALRGSEAPDEPSSGNVVTDRIAAHSGLSVVFHDRWRASLDLPIVLYQWGESAARAAAGVAGLEGAALGDLRLAGDARLFGKYGDSLTGAAGVLLHLPTGSRSQLTGDGTWRVTPHLLFAGDSRGFVYAAQLGYAFRPREGAFAGRPLGNEALLSLAAGVRVNDMFVFGPELFGSTVLDHDQAFSRRATPLELLLGLHVKLADDWQFGSAIGPGLTQGDGCPSMRVVLSVELAPDVCVDADGDGICAPADACPDVDGVRTSKRSTNGCPVPKSPEAPPTTVAPK